jgi:hypothetical protein
MTKNTDVKTILDERGARYGTFANHAMLSQALKMALIDHATEHNKTFADDQKEAMEMICHKLARIVNGDPHYADSWMDIAGYATLVADRLNGVSKLQENNNDTC